MKQNCTVLNKSLYGGGFQKSLYFLTYLFISARFNRPNQEGGKYKLKPISLNRMKRLNVEHYLRVYEGRKKMQESGITQPSNEIVKFTAKFVEILNNLPLEQELEIRDHSFYDSRGKLIATVPQP